MPLFELNLCAEAGDLSGNQRHARRRRIEEKKKN